MSAHLMLCHGPVKKFKRIRIGDRVAWTGDVAVTSTISIDKRELFGGEMREGGFVGPVRLIMGDEFEEVNNYLDQVLPRNYGGDTPEADREIPAFRGIAAIVLMDDAVAANNPNIRPINVECVTVPAEQWYPATSTFYTQATADDPLDEVGVNPAHMIWECLTNSQWGLGYTPLDVDDTSFRQVADTLYAEEFQMNMTWSGGESLEDFISEIVRHIDAVLYVHPRTGLFTLKLIREDYILEDLELYDENSIITMESFDRLGVGELVNQVTVLWYDRKKDKKRPATVHNVPTQELQGGIVAQTFEFGGIPNADLAAKVAARELKKLSSSLSRMVIVTNRKGGKKLPGDVLKISWPDYQIQEGIYRVVKVEFSKSDSSEVRLHLIEDIFGFGNLLYAPPPETGWEDPISEPAPPLQHRLTEGPYILVERQLLESQALISELDPMAGFVTSQATKPSFDAISYNLLTKPAGGEYVLRSTGSFSPTAILQESAGQEVQSTWQISDGLLLSNVTIGQFAIIDDEYVQVTDLQTTQMTVKRGVLDTVPTFHAAGATIWFAEEASALDFTQWASGTTVYGVQLPLTGKGTLAIEAAEADSLVINRRWYRPYPPGNFKVNGEFWPTGQAVGDIVLTWSHRDRTQQLSGYLAQDATSIGPEVGTTYTVRVYNRAGAVVRTVTGLTGTTWTYDSSMESADVPGAAYKIELTSVRDGVESWQPQFIFIVREAVGWGYNWGNFWSGSPVA